jgi:hypothetical protein
VHPAAYQPLDSVEGMPMPAFASFGGVALKVCDTSNLPYPGGSYRTMNRRQEQLLSKQKLRFNVLWSSCSNALNTALSVP